MAADRFRLNVEEAEVVWLGSRAYADTMTLNGLSLIVASCTVEASAGARLLGIWKSPNISSMQHPSDVTTNCFALSGDVSATTRLLPLHVRFDEPL